LKKLRSLGGINSRPYLVNGIFENLILFFPTPFYGEGVRDEVKTFKVSLFAVKKYPLIAF